VKIALTYTPRISCIGSTDKINAQVTVENSNGSTSELADDAEEEFDSPETIDAISNAIASCGFDVEQWGDGPLLMRRLLDSEHPDLIFNLAEGRGIHRSREAWAPALFEMFGIPYTGSDPLTLSATLDKDCARRLVREAGVSVPVGMLVNGSPQEFCAQLAALPFPVIVKPAFEGSSKGLGNHSVIEDYSHLDDAITRCSACYRQPVLVEEFIDGDELTVGILGNNPPTIVGVMRVSPVKNQGRFVYGLDVKRDWRRRVHYEIPVPLSEVDLAAVCNSARTAFRALGCRDVARLDYRFKDGIPYFLEANPLPGLTPESSDLVLLAEGMGIDYRELIERIVNAALQRYQLHTAI
jgi:D-alanine-D-alanine ligase